MSFLNRRSLCAAGLLMLAAVGSARAVDTIFAASGSNAAAGSLYTLNPATGAATLVGPLNDAAGAPYGLTGLAFHPTTGVLYGATVNASGLTAPHSLVRVNPATGQVTLIGDFAIPGGGSMSDITFRPDGTLYGWGSLAHNMFSINLVTGASTLIGASGVGGGFGGGSLASDAGGTIYSTPDSSSNPPGTLRTVSHVTGVATVVAALSGGPVGTNVINASAFNSAGTLLGLNSDQGGVSVTNLVSINTTTGVISNIGPTGIGNMDALAVQVPGPASSLLLGLGGLLAARRRRA